MVTSFQRALAQAEANKERVRREQDRWWQHGYLWVNQGHSSSHTEGDAIECILDECVASELPTLVEVSTNVIAVDFRSDVDILLSIPIRVEPSTGDVIADPISWATREFLPSFLPWANLEEHWQKQLASRQRRVDGQHRRFATKPRGKRYGKQWRRTNGELVAVKS